MPRPTASTPGRALRRSVRWDQNRPARSAVYDARGRSIRTVRTWSGRTPTDVAWRCAALLTMSPAPARQHQRERNLRGDEHAAETDTPPAAALAGTNRRLQRVDRFQRRCLERRGQRYEQRREHRDCGGEQQRGRIQANHRRADPREAGSARHPRRARCDRRAEEHLGVGQQRPRRAKQRHPEHQAGNAAADGEQQALGEQLSGNHAAAGADGDTDRHFPAARRGLGHREIRQVDARNQKNEADRAQEHQRLPAHVAVDTRRFQRQCTGAPAIGAVPLSIHFVDLVSKHTNGGDGLLLRDARLAPAFARVQIQTRAPARPRRRAPAQGRAEVGMLEIGS